MSRFVPILLVIGLILSLTPGASSARDVKSRMKRAEGSPTRAETVPDTRKPFKQVVNDALRRGLSPSVRARRGRPVEVVVHQSELLPGLDSAAFNHLAEDLSAVPPTAGGKRS